MPQANPHQLAAAAAVLSAAAASAKRSLDQQGGGGGSNGFMARGGSSAGLGGAGGLSGSNSNDSKRGRRATKEQKVGSQCAGKVGKGLRGGGLQRVAEGQLRSRCSWQAHIHARSMHGILLLLAPPGA